MRSKINSILHESRDKELYLNRKERDSIWKNLPTLYLTSNMSSGIKNDIPLINYHIDKIVKLIEEGNFTTIYKKRGSKTFSPILRNIKIRMLFMQLIYVIKITATTYNTNLLAHSKAKFPVKWFAGAGARTSDDLFRIVLYYMPKKYWKYFDLDDIYYITILLCIYRFFYSHLCPDALGRVNNLSINDTPSAKLVSGTKALLNKKYYDEHIHEFSPEFIDILKSIIVFDSRNFGDMQSYQDQYKQFLTLEDLQDIFDEGRFSKEEFSIYEADSTCYNHCSSMWRYYAKFRKDITRSLGHYLTTEDDSIFYDKDKFLDNVEKHLKKYTIYDKTKRTVKEETI